MSSIMTQAYLKPIFKWLKTYFNVCVLLFSYCIIYTIYIIALQEYIKYRTHGIHNINSFKSKKKRFMYLKHIIIYLKTLNSIHIGLIYILL